MFAEVEQSFETDLTESLATNTPNKRRKIDQAEDIEGEIPDIPAPDFVMMESKGFVTGKGKAVPPPSKAAFEKAMKIIAAVEEEKDDLANEPTPSVPKASFTTGNGTSVAGPSSAALAAAEKLFGDDGISALAPDHDGQLGTPVKPTGFTTGSGAPAPASSEAAVKRAMAFFGEEVPASDSEAGHSTLATPVKSTRFTTGSGAAAPKASQAARRQALAMFGEESVESPSRPTSSMPPPASTPFRALMQSNSTPQRIAPVMEPLSDFRTPLRTTTNIVAGTSASISSMTAPKRLQPIEIKTPAPQRRVGLGRTPTSTKLGAKNKFSSPFKNPGPSVNSPLKPASLLRTSSAVAGPSGLLRATTPAPVKEASYAVFDLTSKLMLFLSGKG